MIDKLKTSAKIQSQIAFVALAASVIKLHLVDHLTSSLQSGVSRGKKTVYIKDGKKSAFGLYFACHMRLDSMTHKVGGVAHWKKGICKPYCGAMSVGKRNTKTWNKKNR